jgi:RNA polymerase sigma-70 factor, ECF subfamily
VNAFFAPRWSVLPFGLQQMAVADDVPDKPWKPHVVAARQGDPQAFAALVRHAQRPVFGLCLRLVSNEAEAAELAQEAFLRAYQNLDKFELERPFDLWVMAIARNLCLDLLRRRGKVHAQDVDELRETLPSGAASQEEAAIAGQQRQSLEQALASLAAADREVLALYYVHKRTTKEIAGVLGVAPGTIMARLFRAREKLRDRMLAKERSA